MRFRGGGVGHIYMRKVEEWLDGTGWGTTWPSLQDKYPDSGGSEEQDANAQQDINVEGTNEETWEDIDTDGSEDEDGLDVEALDEDEDVDVDDEDTDEEDVEDEPDGL